MTVLFRDEFSGYSAPATSGSAPFTATDNVEQRVWFDFEGTPTTGDKIEYQMTFPGGTVTFVAEWTSSTVIVLKRVSTIAGTSNGTATLQTFNAGSIPPSANAPRSDGDLVRMGFKVNRGAAGGGTAITFTWHGHSSTGTAQTTNTFTVDGELTPTAATFTITGTSFRNRDDLEGRSPDMVGGGTYTWGQQNWGLRGQLGATVIERFDINGLIAENECAPIRAAGNGVDVMYPVDGGVSLMTSTTRLTATIASGQGGLFINFGARWDPVTQSGLLGYLSGPGLVAIGSYTNGSYDGDYDSAGIIDLDDDTPHEYEFVVDEATATARIAIDGVIALTVDISAGAGSLLGPGTVGVGFWRYDRTAAGVVCSSVEFDDEAAVVTTTPDNLVSQHEFYSTYDPPLTDIDGKGTDSYPFAGTITKHPDSGASVSQDGGVGSITGPGRAVYIDPGIQYSCDGVTVDLEADYSAELGVTFPDLDTPLSSYVRRLIWEDNLETLGSGDPLDGRTHDGGLAGVGTYVLEQTGDPDIDAGAEVVGDSEGRAMQPADPTSPRLSLNRLLYRITGLTLPLFFDAELDVYNAAPQDSRQSTIGFLMRWTGSSPVDWNWIIWDVFQHASVGPYRNSYHTSMYEASVSALTTLHTMGPAGSTNEFETRLTAGPYGNPQVSVYFGGAPYSLDGDLDIIFYNGQFSAPVDIPNGDIGIMWSEAGLGAENVLRLDAIRIFDYYAAPGTPALECGTGEVLVRYDSLTDTGYGARVTFDHTGVGDPVVTLTLFERSLGVETRLVPDMDISFGHGTYTLRLDVNGTVLTLKLDGDIMATFDYAADNADETGFPVTAHDEGEPGFAGSDCGSAGAMVKFEQFNVYAPVGCDGNPPNPPCEGPPEGCNPYPGPPPETADIGYWVKQNQKYRFVSLYLGSAIQPYTAPKVNLLHRPRALPSIKANTVYRILTGTGPLEQEPPLPCNIPANYDPCLTIPTFPPPETVDLGDPPQRLLFAYELPINNIGDLFTAAVNAAGPWTTADIAVAVSRSGYIIGNQGSYAKFQSGGVYQPSIHKQWIVSVASYVNAAQATGNLYGLQLFDDWEVPRLWPPSGVSVPVLQDVCGFAKSILPGVRIILRARAQQFSPGSYPGNVDSIISQYRYWGLNGQSPSAYVAVEEGLAATFGWNILWSINLQHGGALIGGQRYPMSLSQAAAALDVFCNDTTNCHGVGNWKYDSPSGGGSNWFAQAGALDVWAVAYNDLAARGAP